MLIAELTMEDLDVEALLDLWSWEVTDFLQVLLPKVLMMRHDSSRFAYFSLRCSLIQSLVIPMPECTF